MIGTSFSCLPPKSSLKFLFDKPVSESLYFIKGYFLSSVASSNREGLMKSGDERRREPRFRPGAGAIAVSANNPGHIQNISMGGLSFVYLHSEPPSPDGESIDILDGQNDFFMEAIPCRTVSEKLLVNESSFSMIRMAQRSVQFGALSRSQQDELEAYILRHSTCYV